MTKRAMRSAISGGICCSSFDEERCRTQDGAAVSACGGDIGRGALHLARCEGISASLCYINGAGEQLLQRVAQRGEEIPLALQQLLALSECLQRTLLLRPVRCEQGLQRRLLGLCSAQRVNARHWLCLRQWVLTQMPAPTRRAARG